MTATAASELSYALSDEHELLRSTVREFAETQVAPVAEELDRTGTFPYDIVRGMADLGIMGITIPEEYGGAGSDTLAYAIAFEELARIDSSVSITMCAHHSLGSLPIYYFGDEDQKQRWLPELASGAKLGAFGLTEPGAGSDAAAARTTARLEGDEWVVNGSKIFITNAGTDISKMVSITAVTGKDAKGRDEISNIVIPNGTPGYSISAPMKKMGWHASDTRELSFEDCRVPADHLLGPQGKGFTQFLRILDGGRIGVAALGLGLAQGAFEQAVEYAKTRNQFGKPIAGF
jgi:alkylation response protein AidB-like acyl-CoA dehydrogenase